MQYNKLHMTGRHQISLLETKFAADLTLQIPPQAAAVSTPRASFPSPAW